MHPRLLSILFAGSAFILLGSPGPAAQTLLPDSLFLPVLEAACLEPGELTCFGDNYERDVFRLPIVDSLMARPAQSERLLAPLCADLLAPPAEEDPLGAPELSLLSRVPLWLREADGDPEPLDWEFARLLLLTDLGREPIEPAHFVYNLMPGLLRQRSSALAGLDDAEQAAMLTGSLAILEEMEGADEIYHPLELRALEEEYGERFDATLAAWTKVDRAALYRCAYRFVRDMLFYTRIYVIERFELAETPLGIAHPDGYEFPDGSRVTGPLHYAAASDWGNLVVAGDASNSYEGDFLFILDLGGDDHYRLDAPHDYADRTIADSHRGFRCLYDLAGNDHYEALENGALAGAFLGASLLVDQAGDDIYRARSFDLGCGWLGLGVLADRAGDDYYAGDTAVMGAGCLGAGLLIDEDGQDVYRAHLYAQGFGYVAGLGLLLDRKGSDLYAALPKYTDILRYEDHSLTLSQGFSIGARPDYSGGIGILDDRQGNDAYQADIYGQGSAYWYSLGLLHDHGGNDRYDSYQYSQGAGIHLAVGLLLDDAGNDSYSSHGVGQGCGHDLAVGLLQDLAGNDRYSCDDLSQGAGSANGIGVLLDASGLDGYLSKGPTAPAYGNPRRHFGSVGLLADGGGNDFASRPIEPGERVGSLTGVYLDLAGESAGPVWDSGAAVAYRDSAYSWSDYFLLAGSGEPRFREWQQAGMDSLIAHPRETIPVLIGFFDTKSARQRHRLKDIMRAIGEPAVKPLREVLRSDVMEYRGMAMWCLENIRDAAAYPELMAILTDPRHFRDEVAVLAALARLQDLDDGQLRLLEATCEAMAERPDCHPFVLKEIAYVLRSHKIGKADFLVDLAEREHYAPRWVAAQALAERENWGSALAAAWRRALAAGDTLRLRRLSLLLPLRPAREFRPLAREALNSPPGGSAPLRRALLRALLAHPDGEGPTLGGLRRDLAAEYPNLRPTLN